MRIKNAKKKIPHLTSTIALEYLGYDANAGHMFLAVSKSAKNVNLPSSPGTGIATVEMGFLISPSVLTGNGTFSIAN